MNSLYHEFVVQFHEVAEKVEVPAETIEQYHRFTGEYNAFVQNFQAAIADLLKAGKTDIEPPSVKAALELPRTVRS